jgi:hypothetical protein
MAPPEPLGFSRGEVQVPLRIRDRVYNTDIGRQGFIKEKIFFFWQVLLL